MDVLPGIKFNLALGGLVLAETTILYYIPSLPFFLILANCHFVKSPFRQFKDRDSLPHTEQFTLLYLQRGQGPSLLAPSPWL